LCYLAKEFDVDAKANESADKAEMNEAPKTISTRSNKVLQRREPCS